MSGLILDTAAAVGDMVIICSSVNMDVVARGPGPKHRINQFCRHLKIIQHCGYIKLFVKFTPQAVKKQK